MNFTKKIWISVALLSVTSSSFAAHLKQVSITVPNTKVTYETVLPKGAKLVAGKSGQNEFYILGKQEAATQEMTVPGVSAVKVADSESAALESSVANVAAKENAVRKASFVSAANKDNTASVAPTFRVASNENARSANLPSSSNFKVVNKEYVESSASDDGVINKESISKIKLAFAVQSPGHKARLAPDVTSHQFAENTVKNPLVLPEGARQPTASDVALPEAAFKVVNENAVAPKASDMTTQDQRALQNIGNQTAKYKMADKIGAEKFALSGGVYPSSKESFVKPEIVHLTSNIKEVKHRSVLHASKNKSAFPKAVPLASKHKTIELKSVLAALKHKKELHAASHAASKRKPVTHALALHSSSRKGASHQAASHATKSRSILHEATTQSANTKHDVLAKTHHAAAHKVTKHAASKTLTSSSSVISHHGGQNGVISLRSSQKHRKLKSLPVNAAGEDV